MAKALARTVLIQVSDTGRSDGNDDPQRVVRLAGTMRFVVAYDIADDRRREDVATVLSGYEPRVQLSVFECDMRTRREAALLRAKLRRLIDPVED